jgi:N4-gp56 family major capsid protein
MLTRATLPQEFYDITSDMLLVQPQKQYLHAILLKSALGVSLNPDNMLGMPGRQFGASGAEYSSAESDRLMLDDPLLAAAAIAVPELGMEKIGHVVNINRPVYLNTTYTQASREVASGATISTTPVDVSSEQASITLKRFAGPYSSAVQPLAADRFDSTKAVHKVAGILGKQLKDDFDHTIDAFGVALWDASANKIRPVGMATDDTSAVAGDFPMDFNTISRAEQKLDELNIPYFANGKRCMILSPRQCQQLEDDSQFARYAKEHASVNPLLTQSYYKSVAKFDIYKSNSVTVTANSNSVDIHKGQAFGPGMVGLGCGSLPRTAYSSTDNYGETALVIWLWYAGFATLDNRFGVGVHSS